MNIFYLDNNIEKCAQYHTDKHVVKMILESTQMLCTVLNTHGQPTPYRATHKRHPCTVWVGKSLSNWRWLRSLVVALHNEWRYRFEHNYNHKSYNVAMSLAEPNISDIGITKRPLAMPDLYKSQDVVHSYRAYYMGEKSHLFSWRKRSEPYWL